jgi:hypothetical protein
MKAGNFPLCAGIEVKTAVQGAKNHQGGTNLRENKGGITMKGLTLSFGLAVLACLPMLGVAQDTPADLASDPITYTLVTVNFPTDVSPSC